MSTAEKYELGSAIRMLGEELASANDNQSSPEFTVIVEGRPRNLHPIVREELYRFAAEALRNAFRHAAAQRIEVEIRYDGVCLRLRVRDDGKGIDPEVPREGGRDGHYGFQAMWERANLVRGKLAIWSAVGSGTEIELIIPAPRAKSTRRFWSFGKRSATDADLKGRFGRLPFSRQVTAQSNGSLITHGYDPDHIIGDRLFFAVKKSVLEKTGKTAQLSSSSFSLAVLFSSTFSRLTQRRTKPRGV